MSGDIVASPPTPRDGVEDHHFAMVEEFLHALSPLHELWAEYPPAWIYRGQADADWTLKATAVRLADVFRPFSLEGDATNWSARSRMSERRLQGFRTRLDRSGITVPQPIPSVDGTDEHTTSSSAEPGHKSFPLMALAQHHGLPTLLLASWDATQW